VPDGAEEDGIAVRHGSRREQRRLRQGSSGLGRRILLYACIVKTQPTWPVPRKLALAWPAMVLISLPAGTVRRRI
jgi:hypothetical protein